jgi:hypothetical protein
MSIAEIIKGEKCPSWIIKDRVSGKVICEVFDENCAKYINKYSNGYEAVPIYEYLSGILK